jgi:hypothetical protein
MTGVGGVMLAPSTSASSSDRDLQSAAEQQYLLPAGAYGHDLYSHDLYGYGALGPAAASRARKQVSDWQAFYHFVSFLSGSGMLCLPLALVEIDWYGMLLLVAAAAVSSFTCKILIEALDVVRWSRGSNVWYSDLADECFGRLGKHVTTLVVHACFLTLAIGSSSDVGAW